MYHVYTTRAFVIHSSSHGEAGKFLLLFTKDFGMIGATAQGIRLSQSKLRYHVQDSNFSNISVVRGKEVWRLVGAQELEHEKNTEVHLKILKLLKRLLHGEEKNEKLFEILEELYKDPMVEKDYELVEYLTVFRILNTLGYVRGGEDLAKFFENNSINRDILDQFSQIKKTAVKMINDGLKESQL